MVISKGTVSSRHDDEAPGVGGASARHDAAAPPAPMHPDAAGGVDSAQLPARSIERDGPNTAASWREEVARSRPVPRSVGPYRDLEPIGEGGMGVVYRARHQASNAVVALKTVSIPGTLRIDGLRREIRALSRIRHPGIVRIVEHGVHEGLPWYAMDLIEGECLRQLGRRIWNVYRPPSTGPLGVWNDAARLSETAALDPKAPRSPGVSAPAAVAAAPSELAPAAAGHLRLVLRLMRRVCATLAYLHGEGIINCDLKPDNLIVAEDQPVLIDFGLATRHPGAHSREALEVRHALSGTLPYVSPEQARGEFTDARSDLYSFGCMLYELVVGEVPFTGAPHAILSQHFSTPPVPPSQRVSGVPPELERCILKLLEKPRSLRPGHADEVAALLADLSGDVHSLSNYPPAGGYIYRSRLVGREAELAQLLAARQRCLQGSGSLVLVGGESGVGKTRLVMELTQLALGAGLKVITGEAASQASEGASHVRPAPLQLFRPLLRAAADLCLEEGPAQTEALLGPRRSVLAMYEPLLSQVPANDVPAPPVRLGVQASRDRLFRYLRQTLSGLAQKRPTLLVLDDIMWADELSLAFLASLDEAYLLETPVLVLCTHRSEDAEAVAALAAKPHVQSLSLTRLQSEAVQSMVTEMLALQEPPRGLVEFVSHEAEGNPFFAGEYLRAAVQERLLFRSAGAWQVAGDDLESAYRGLQLPGSVRELIARRLQRTSASAQAAATAAAVLGREAEVDVLREVSALSDEALMDALTELTRRQLLEVTPDDRVRFVHDKLREVSYSLCSPELRRELHERAGNALSARLEQRSLAARHWAAIGQHFVEAQLPEQAVRYLDLAAGHARATSAHRDAIRLYREALRQIDELALQLSAAAESWDDRWRELQEALGDVLVLAGEREEAPLAFEQALERTPEPAVLARARLYRKLGECRELEFRHEEALALFKLSMQAAGENPATMTSECRDEWLHAQIDRQRVFYWLNRIDEMDRLVSEVRPIVEQFGTAERIVEFCHSQMQLNLRRDRYVASEQTLRLARRALDVCPKKDSFAELLRARFMCGFALLFNRAYAAAEAELEAGLSLSTSVGDLALQARCLTYLAVASRMRGDVHATDERSLRLLRMAREARMQDYLGAARAHRAWVLLQQGDTDGAERAAREAVTTWRALTTYSYPFQWLAYLPLLELLLSRGDVAGASECVEPVLAPDQQALDGSATDGLLRGLKLWRAGDAQGAAAAFRRAQAQLSSSGYR